MILSSNIEVFELMQKFGNKILKKAKINGLIDCN